MRDCLICSALAGFIVMWSAAPAFATDVKTPKPRHKRAQHTYVFKPPPGPILAITIARPPTCNTAWPFHYPNYKQASCRDYGGVATFHDPRSPDGRGAQGFHVLYGLH